MPIDHDDVRAGMDRELHVVEDARRADLHVHGLFRVRQLPQLPDLDREIVGPVESG